MMRIAIYKDTLANNRGADVAVQYFTAGLSERGHAVVLDNLISFGTELSVGGL